jgi:hypothetical protein
VSALRGASKMPAMFIRMLCERMSKLRQLLFWGVEWAALSKRFCQAGGDNISISHLISPSMSQLLHETPDSLFFL